MCIRDRQGADLGGKYQVVAGLRPVEGLNPESIARQQQLAGVLVEDRDREHATKSGQEVRAPLLVQVRNQLCIARAVQLVPLLDQFLTQLSVVIDLTIEDRPVASLLCPGGLIAGRQVQQREASKRQTGIGPCLLYTSDAADDLTRVDLG